MSALFKRRLAKSRVAKGVLALVAAAVWVNVVWVLGRGAVVSDVTCSTGSCSPTPAETTDVRTAQRPVPDSEPRPASPGRAEFVSTSTCPGLTVAGVRQELGFQAVRGSSTFLYAAHQEDDHVTLIALVRDRRGAREEDLFCQLWRRVPSGADPLTVTEAEVEPINEGHGRRYTAAFIKCPLAGETPVNGSAVVAVGVVSGHKCQPSPPTAPPLAVLAPPPADGKLTSEFTVCVTPFNFRYSRAYQLVEMIEFNKILGADKIVFYNYSTGPNVDQVLQMYTESRDVVDVLPWPLPVHANSWPPGSGHPPEVWYFGQLAALNDCLLRHRHRARYIVFTDLDEFIVPVEDPDWAGLVTRLREDPRAKRRARGQDDIFIVRCTFFRKEWPQPVEEFSAAASKFRSAVLGYTLRESQVIAAGSRSKLMVDPRAVQEVGVHQVWRGGKSLAVPPSLALLHHYRSWESPDQKVKLTTSKEAALRFGARLAAKLQEVWARLPGVKMDIDLASYGGSVS